MLADHSLADSFFLRRIMFCSSTVVLSTLISLQPVRGRPVVPVVSAISSISATAVSSDISAAQSVVVTIRGFTFCWRWPCSKGGRLFVLAADVFPVAFCFPSVYLQFASLPACLQRPVPFFLRLLMWVLLGFLRFSSLSPSLQLPVEPVFASYASGEIYLIFDCRQNPTSLFGKMPTVV